MNRDEVNDALNSHVLEIVFTKMNGDDRTMRCTHDFTIIPESAYPKGTLKQMTEELKRVFDLEKNEWRSFKWNSVKSAKII